MTTNTNSAQERTASIDLAQLDKLIALLRKPEGVVSRGVMHDAMAQAADFIEATLARRSLTSGAPAEWQPINTLPESDDLVWLRRGDSIEGPRVMDPYDFDRFTDWAPCEPPRINGAPGHDVAAPKEALQKAAALHELALVPLYPNREMRDVMAEDEWKWEDLLASAAAITEDQYEAIATHPDDAAAPIVKQKLPAPLFSSVTHIADAFGSGAIAYTPDEVREILSAGAAAKTEQELRDTLIELANTQRKLIDANAEIAAIRLSATAAGAGSAQPEALEEQVLFGFDRDDLDAVADGLECGYEKFIDVGGSPFDDGSNLIESTTAVAAKFIRAALAQQAAPEATATTASASGDMPPLSASAVGIDANKLKVMAKERPDECFLKGSGVLKLIGAIQHLESVQKVAEGTSRDAGQEEASTQTVPGIDTPEFRKLLEWVIKDVGEPQKSAHRKNLIAYIDGRTAGTAGGDK